MLGLRPPSPAGGPPSRLAARQGFGVNRSFRAAAAVPSRVCWSPSARSGLRQALALPLLRAPFRPGRSGSPRASSGGRARGPGAFAARRRAWPPFGGWRPWCGCAAGRLGAGPFLPWSRYLVVVGGWGRGPVARPQAGLHPTDRGRASGGRQRRLTVQKKSNPHPPSIGRMGSRRWSALTSVLPFWVVGRARQRDPQKGSRPNLDTIETPKAINSAPSATIKAIWG